MSIGQARLRFDCFAHKRPSETCYCLPNSCFSAAIRLMALTSGERGWQATSPTLGHAYGAHHAPTLTDGAGGEAGGQEDKGGK